jgi:hypothetical protein
MKGSVLFLSLGENFGKILKCTKNIEELTGYEEKEIVKREIKLLMPDSIGKIHD